MSFVGLYTGLSGIRAAQTGIDVASNNVANSATDGYTRQRVEQSARPSYTSLVGQVGTGVDVSSIDRLRDVFLDDRARTAAADDAFTSTRSELLGRMEDLTGEPDHGITQQLTSLWSAAETWANDPADVPSRRQVLTELSAVAETFRSTASQWDALAEDVATRRTLEVETVNDALGELHALDRRIANADTSRVGTEVFDQRDRLLDQVAELTGARARIGEDGRSQIRLPDGPDLIATDGASQLRLADDGRLVATDAGGTEIDVHDQVGGRLGGLSQVLDQDLAEWQGALDRLAQQLATAVNDVNTNGKLASGQPGDELLGAIDSTTGETVEPTARTLRLLTDDPAALAAATDDGTTDPPEPHEGGAARAFADLRLTAVADGDGGTGTLDDQLADAVTGLAAQVRAANAASDTSSGIANQASTARDAQHGVSTDEEMVSLVRYQRALEAASRVMTTVDEALDTIVNRTGLVGR